VNWSKKHAYYLGTVIGKLQNEMKFSMEVEEEAVYDRVIRAIESIADVEVHNMEWNERQQPIEIEEDELH
jgi:hypothetical protein